MTDNLLRQSKFPVLVGKKLSFSENLRLLLHFVKKCVILVNGLRKYLEHKLTNQKMQFVFGPDSSVTHLLSAVFQPHTSI